MSLTPLPIANKLSGLRTFSHSGCAILQASRNSENCGGEPVLDAYSRPLLLVINVSPIAVRFLPRDVAGAVATRTTKPSRFMSGNKPT